MRTAFSLTINSVRPSRRVGRVVGAATTLLVATMIGWAVFGQVPIYVTTANARIEVMGSAYAVQVEGAGTVQSTNLELGREVKRGEILLRLDDSAQSLELEREKTKVQALADLKAAIRRELTIEKEALAAHERTVAATQRAGSARTSVAKREAELAMKEDEIIQKLHKENLSSGLEKIRQEELARVANARAQAVARETDEAVTVKSAANLDRRAVIARLDSRLTELEGQIRQGNRALALLEKELERRVVRATTDGTLGELVAVTPGTYVAAGTRIATIVPKRAQQIVASFPPEVSVGRIRQGQHALVRLDAFPWAQFGVVGADVVRAGAEPRDGSVRVELSPTAVPAGVPLTHGLTGTVEVEVERVAPWRLLIRAAGQRLSQPAPEPPAHPSAAAEGKLPD